LATNAILERRGVPVALVTTKGFRSLLALGRHGRVEEERYDLFFEAPEPVVPRARTFEVLERLDARGHVVHALDEDAARAVARRIAALDVAAVAICFLHSYVDDAHERRMAEIVAEEVGPAVGVTTSADVLPELREYERLTTTVMSAAVGPVMSAYLRSLRERLDALGVTVPVQVMDSAGGVMTTELAARRAVHTIESGPAAGVVAARHSAAAHGLADVLAFDMGGTTAKAGLVRGGRPDVRRGFVVGGKGSFGGRRAGSGVPVQIPAIDLAEVGSGGGSIAWVDAGGAVRVGPRSAGADPGPACYGRGGTLPTVTDADLLLGHLDGGSFAGGRMALDRDLAEAALREHVAEPLGLDVLAAADAVHRIVDADMGMAIQVITVQRGIDPRRFTVVASGGAGPVHVCRTAEQFGIRRVLVPAHTGVGSAIGLLVTDLETERSRTRIVDLATVDPAEVTALLDELAAGAAADLGVAVGAAGVDVLRSASLRYRGQAHELEVPLPGGVLDRAALDRVATDFYAGYLQAFGIDLRAPLQLVSARARVVQRVDRAGIGAGPRGDGAAAGAAATTERTRPAWFSAAEGLVDTPVVRREACRGGPSRPGPLIVEEDESTIVVPPGWTAAFPADGVVWLDHGGPERATEPVGVPA
jgi:N-methylhydantoinase A